MYTWLLSGWGCKLRAGRLVAGNGWPGRLFIAPIWALLTGPFEFRFKFWFRFRFWFCVRFWGRFWGIMPLCRWLSQAALIIAFGIEFPEFPIDNGGAPIPKLGLPLLRLLIPPAGLFSPELDLALFWLLVNGREFWKSCIAVWKPCEDWNPWDDDWKPWDDGKPVYGRDWFCRFCPRFCGLIGGIVPSRLGRVVESDCGCDPIAGAVKGGSRLGRCEFAILLSPGFAKFAVEFGNEEFDGGLPCNSLAWFPWWLIWPSCPHNDCWAPGCIRQFVRQCSDGSVRQWIKTIVR